MIDERRAHEILGRLLTVAPAERDAWLQNAIPDDPELRARLLRAAGDTPDADADATVDVPVSFADAASSGDPIVGQPLGAFVVESRLAEQGGMGTVYRGRRSDGTFAQ